MSRFFCSSFFVYIRIKVDYSMETVYNSYRNVMFFSYWRCKMIFKYLDTPIGEMVAVANDEGICMLEFKDMTTLETDLLKLKEIYGGEPVMPGKNAHLDLLTEEITAYFQRKLTTFTVPVVKWGTSFQNQVWRALETIQYGETMSYSDIASNIGNPKAVRAVGMANGRNKIAIIIPCHRVIGANGTLTGYAGGLWRKEWLLDHEKGTAVSK